MQGLVAWGHAGFSSCRVYTHTHTRTHTHTHTQTGAILGYRTARNKITLYTGDAGIHTHTHAHTHTQTGAILGYRTARNKITLYTGDTSTSCTGTKYADTGARHCNVKMKIYKKALPRRLGVGV